MTLKNACAILMKRISSLDYIFQFVSAATFTAPLRIVLNGWVHDQDQTEFQPGYEEFAVILLFLNTIVHVSSMSVADHGLSQEDLFTTKFLFGSNNTSATDLTDEQDKQLSSWIQGLFVTDDHGDPVGITDEVYSQCPPQAFYLLVPILFEQTALACKLKAISVNTMQGGLEFLLEPFLLPALIPGLRWIAETSWTDVESTNVRLHMLEKLLKSSSASQEVQTMHKAILTIVAQPLEISLQALQRIRSDKKKEVTKFLEILKPYTARNTRHGQLTAWSSAEGGMIASVRSCIRHLAAWSTSGSPSTASKWSPTVVWQATQILGPGEVLKAIITEVQLQTSTGGGPLAIDLSTAMICGPSHLAQPGLPLNGIDVNNLGLRDSLRLLIADEHALLQLPSKQAEAMVRLSRSVEAQLGLSPLASQLDLVTLALPTGEATDQVMQDLGLSATDASLNAVAAAALDPAVDASFANTSFGLTDDSTLDMAKAPTDTILDDSMNLDGNDIFGDLGMNLTGQHALLGNSTATGEQNLVTNADDDIFADLDMGDLGEDFTF
ncbi:hypothetical protein AMS68_003578 [Peltaster fructicola]|uniref:Mediator of RNA polymerase II transcription subunit 5 n=1 Tax=Peltaster fructicola TaxID=286661 RepID=A0A6H0XTQ9_9PEZI|nr:hypothetical protein AMS68_003578 [Peltaster fructicola]